MILAFDTHYRDDHAKTVAVQFVDWPDPAPQHIEQEITEDIAAYEPGAFYKRELPCIFSLLKQFDLAEVSHMVVDGYVQLNDQGMLGLGGHLFHELGEQVPIIGVAKTAFHNNTLHTRELLRGDSKRPLFITAIGMDVDHAHDLIKSMHGKYRMPTLLQILDTNTKER